MPWWRHWQKFWWGSGFRKAVVISVMLTLRLPAAVELRLEALAKSAHRQLPRHF
jgi:hypothetical protein